MLKEFEPISEEQISCMPLTPDGPIPISVPMMLCKRVVEKSSINRKRLYWNRHFRHVEQEEIRDPYGDILLAAIS
jgi:hypothetical protein